MIKERRQRGKPTYKRNQIEWIFDIDSLRRINILIVNDFSNKYYIDLPDRDVNYGYIHTTNFGPFEYFSVKLKKYAINVGCYNDGWHIKLAIGGWGESVTPEIKKTIFGDFNTNSMWTQETEKVADMMGELYREIMELYNE